MTLKQVFLDFLKNFIISFGWKQSKMKTNVDIFITYPISGKILVLELWAKILLANQAAGFFKMQYLKKEVNDEVYFWHADKYQIFLQVDNII